MTELAPPSPDTTLRDRLIDAAIALLNEGGPQGLTPRRAAARAGVSHAAPAHHFHGLAGLQTAVAGRAFRLFSQAMSDRRDAAPDTPFGKLLGICEGYLDFATDHGGLFHIMFTCREIDRDTPDVQVEAGRSYRILRDGCLPFSGGAPDPVLEAAVWTCVHGFASLGFLAPRQQAGGTAPPAFAAVLKKLLALT